MGNVTINHHFQQQTVKLPEGRWWKWSPFRHIVNRRCGHLWSHPSTDFFFLKPWLRVDQKNKMLGCPCPNMAYIWFILVYIGLYYMLIYVNLCSSNTTVDHGTHKSWLNPIEMPSENNKVVNPINNHPHYHHSCGLYKPSWNGNLVGGFNPSEKYDSQLGWLFPIYGKNKFHVPNHQPAIYIPLPEG